jgi:hypothetical protein
MCVFSHAATFKGLRHAMRRLVAVVLACAFALALAATASAQGADPQRALGVVAQHGSFSLLPWEHIDTYTGNVLLSFTDLVLPGNAGFNLTVQRTYNSNGGWRWAVAPEWYVSSPADPNAYPVLRDTDGRDIYLLRTATGDYMTPGFWKLSGPASSRKLELPSGAVWHFDAAGHATLMEDPFGNQIEVTWDSQWGRVNHEPYRVCRRAHSLRGWPYGTTKSVRT